MSRLRVTVTGRDQHRAGGEQGPAAAPTLATSGASRVEQPVVAGHHPDEEQPGHEDERRPVLTGRGTGRAGVEDAAATTARPPSDEGQPAQSATADSAGGGQPGQRGRRARSGRRARRPGP